MNRIRCREDLCLDLINDGYIEAANVIEDLAADVEKLEAAIRHHRDQKGDDRCRLDDLKLYNDALGEDFDPYQGALPPDECMLESCRRYVEQRKNPDHVALLPGGMTIQQLTDKTSLLMDLVRHVWVHAGHSDCGYLQMTTPEKNLYNETIGRSARDTLGIYGWLPKTDVEFNADRAIGVTLPDRNVDGGTA